MNVWCCPEYQVKKGNERTIIVFVAVLRIEVAVQPIESSSGRVERFMT
jgi:hypothetical protein